MMNFCTIFDSYYLDKAMVLYESLCKVASDEFHIYIFCFDDRSREILGDMKLGSATILHHTNLEETYPELVDIKKTRSKAEYCWTCTPASIEYVLNHFEVDNCTYIDADLCFFSNPKVLFEEIENTRADIVITPHRFSDSLKDRRLEKRSGKYCVEFNYFNQSENAKKCLTWWRERCFEWCYHLYEPDRMGDQKYLMKFASLFEGVHELEHLGGGMAPWNLAQYEIVDGREMRFKVKKTGEEFSAVFYHFQNIRYISETTINISSETHSKKTKDALYKPYIKAICDMRDRLKSEHGLEFSLQKRYASNKFIAFLQGTVLRFRIKSLSDIYDVRKL